MDVLLHGLAASPSLGTEITSVLFPTRTNVLNLKELFFRDVVTFKVADKLSLIIHVIHQIFSLAQLV